MSFDIENLAYLEDPTGGGDYRNHTITYEDIIIGIRSDGQYDGAVIRLLETPANKTTIQLIKPYLKEVREWLSEEHNVSLEVTSETYQAFHAEKEKEEEEEKPKTSSRSTSDGFLNAQAQMSPSESGVHWLEEMRSRLPALDVEEDEVLIELALLFDFTDKWVEYSGKTMLALHAMAIKEVFDYCNEREFQSSRKASHIFPILLDPLHAYSNGTLSELFGTIYQAG